MVFMIIVLIGGHTIDINPNYRFLNANLPLGFLFIFPCDVLLKPIFNFYKILKCLSLLLKHLSDKVLQSVCLLQISHHYGVKQGHIKLRKTLEQNLDNLALWKLLVDMRGVVTRVNESDT